jgi:deoxyribose-phosphate aldolase
VTTLDSGVDSLADVTSSEDRLRRFLLGLPGVDQVGAETRAATLSTRSIKTTAMAYALYLAFSMMDLTPVVGLDTPGMVRALCA